MFNLNLILILFFSSILTVRTQYSKCEGDKLEDRQINAVKDTLGKKRIFLNFVLFNLFLNRKNKFFLKFYSI